MTASGVDPGRELSVVRVRPVADRIAEVILTGSGLPRWAPGAHVDLVLPDGAIRPYSLAGDPDDTRSWRLLVAGRRRLRVGDTVRARGPRNRFPLGGATRYLFLGSGAGLAPLLPMVRRVRAARVHPWALVHVDPSSRHTALRDEVQDLGPDSRSVPRRTPVEEALAQCPPGTAVYACGSSRFVDAVADATPPGVDLHRQRFDAATGERPFEVVLARRGQRISVPPATSLLSALHSAGVDVPASCGAGLCGACVVGVLDGRVEHRDAVLTAAERAGRIVTCVSRAAGDRLALDL